MQENNLKIIDLTSEADEEISADKVRHLREDIDYLDNQLSIANAMIDEKDIQLERAKQINNSQEKEILKLKDKLIDAHEEILSLIKAQIL